jgi:hypothetical protein
MGQVTVTARTTFGIVRLALAAVCIVALVSRCIWGLGSVTFNAANFFAYLTIQSNIAFAVIAVLAGVSALRRTTDPKWMTTARAVVLSCTVTAGIVFGILIQQAGERSFRIDVPWSDQVLHFWLPAVAILEFLFAPGRGPAPWRTIPVVLGYPIVWGLATLWRGSVVGWYPYFFLNPALADGIGEFALFSGLALLLFAGLAAGFVALSHLRPLVGDAAASRPLAGRSERLECAPGRRDELGIAEAEHPVG